MTLIRTSTVWRAIISTTVFVTAFQTCIEGILSEFHGFTHEGPMDDETAGVDDDGYSGFGDNITSTSGSSTVEQEFFSVENLGFNFETENSGTSEFGPLGEFLSYKTTPIDLRRVETQSSGDLQHTTASPESDSWPIPLESDCCECTMASVQESNLIAIVAAEFAIFDEL